MEVSPSEIISPKMCSQSESMCFANIYYTEAEMAG